MSSSPKSRVLADLKDRFGDLHKLKGSESLYILRRDAARIYFRYSKVHERGRTFFGLRAIDLRQLEGQNSYICLLLDNELPRSLSPTLISRMCLRTLNLRGTASIRFSCLRAAMLSSFTFRVRHALTSRAMSALKPSRGAWRHNKRVITESFRTHRYRHFSPGSDTPRVTMCTYLNATSAG